LVYASVSGWFAAVLSSALVPAFAATPAQGKAMASPGYPLYTAARELFAGFQLED